MCLYVDAMWRHHIYDMMESFSFSSGISHVRIIVMNDDDVKSCTLTSTAEEFLAESEVATGTEWL